MKVAVFTVFAAVVLVGCSPLDESSAKRLAMPKAGSTESESMWNLWLGAWSAVLVAYVLVFGMIIYSVVKFHRKDPNAPAPRQIRYNLPLEALYTIAPIIVISVFFFHTITIQNDVVTEDPNPDHTIEVVGSKWQWTFNYLEPEANGGVDVFDQGDTANLPSLYLPVNESVRFELISPDVIHSFWVPEFYYKLDVVPGNIQGKDGKPNSFTVTPNRTGEFTGRCAELCGKYHSRMMFKVHVVERAEYDQHMRDLEAAGQTGRPIGTEHTQRIPGLKTDGDDN